MIRILYCLLLLIYSYCTYGQGSFVSELPFRGTPIKMVKTIDNGFLLIAQIANPYDAVAIKYDENGNYIMTTRMVNIDSLGAGGFPSLMQISSNTYLLRISRVDSGQYFYKLNINGEKIDSFSMSSPNMVMPPCILSNNHIYGQSAQLHKVNLNFQVDTSVNIPNQVWQLSSNNNNQILLSGPEAPNPTYFRLYDNNLNLVKSRAYSNMDHKPLPLFNGWVFHNKGLFKLNANLDSVWNHPYTEYKFSGSENQETMDIKQTSDGGFILTGEVWNPFYHVPFLIKTDSMGNLEWKKGYDVIADCVVSVEQTDNGGYVMFQGGQQDTLFTRRLFIVKTNPDGTLGVNNYDANKIGVQIFPNPVSDQINVIFKSVFSGKIQLVDLTGRILFTETINEASEISIPNLSLENGFYILNVYQLNSDNLAVFKILKN